MQTHLQRSIMKVHIKYEIVRANRLILQIAGQRIFFKKAIPKFRSKSYGSNGICYSNCLFLYGGGALIAAGAHRHALTSKLVAYAPRFDAHLGVYRTYILPWSFRRLRFACAQRRRAAVADIMNDGRRFDLLCGANVHGTHAVYLNVAVHCDVCLW